MENPHAVLVYCVRHSRTGWRASYFGGTLRAGLANIIRFFVGIPIPGAVLWLGNPLGTSAGKRRGSLLMPYW